MMDFIRKFVLKGLHDAIGKEPEYITRRYAKTYYNEGILTDDDMAALDAALDAQKPQPEPEAAE